MLLVVDIGNTNTVLGVFDGDALLTELRFKSDAARTVDEYSSLILPLLRSKLHSENGIDRCVISSVVPLLTPIFKTLVQNEFRIIPLVVGPGVKTGLQIKIHEPATVGADRVVNALAAKHLFGAPVIVVDFGTATSFDYVNSEGNYEGGVIAPGLRLSLESLVRNTAKLPSIDIVWPKSVLGKSTVSAMQSGVVIGYVCMVDGLLDQMIKEVGAVDCVIATGGLGEMLSAHSKRITSYEKHLTLLGLKLMADMNISYA